MSPSVLSEHELARRIGGYVAQTSSFCFDALHVSVREAIPSSSLTSEALTASVSALSDSHFAALQAAFAAVAGVRTKESAVHSRPEAVDSSALAQEERELDFRLHALRSRSHHADVAAAELDARKKELARAMSAAREISAKVQAHGSDEGGQGLLESADAAVSELRAEAATMDSVRALLEESNVPLLERAASAIRKVPSCTRGGRVPAHPLLSAGLEQDGADTDIETSRLDALGAALRGQ